MDAIADLGLLTFFLFLILPYSPTFPPDVSLQELHPVLCVHGIRQSRNGGLRCGLGVIPRFHRDHFRQKIAIMGNDKHGPGILAQGVNQGFTAFKIQMVGRFVEDQKISPTEKQRVPSTRRFFPRRLILQLFFPNIVRRA